MVDILVKNKKLLFPFLFTETLKYKHERCVANG